MALMLNFVACERRLLEDDVIITNGAKIPLSIFWTKAGIIPQNVTVLVYDEGGYLYLEKIFENKGTSVNTDIYLPVGKYTLVTFNEKRDQIDYVRMRGHEHLSTLEAFVTTTKTTYSSPLSSEDDIKVEQPGPLAVAMDTITVTQQDVENTRLSALGKTPIGSTLKMEIFPIIKTCKVNITIHVLGICNSRLPVLGELRNNAGGYLLGEDKNSSQPVTIQFLLSNCVYTDEAKRDGKLITTITSFGIPGSRLMTDDIDRRIILNLSFQLVDKERTVISFSLDVTNSLKIKQNDDMSITIDLTIDQSLYPELKLPDVIPEQGGGNGGGSGMVSELIDWESVSVPIAL